MKKKLVWITGIRGQLGCELTKLFIQHPIFNFIGVGRSMLDITKKEDIDHFLTKHSIDYIIHCAAYTKVDQAELEKNLCYDINHKSVNNLLEVSKGKVKFLYISTDYVFDGESSIPYTENDYTHPLSVYGKSKLNGEVSVMYHCTRSIIVRTSWLYSQFGINFVKTIFNLLKNKNDLYVVSDQIGTPTYAEDLAKAILSILFYWEKINPFCSCIFHYSNEGKVSWFDFAKKIAELLNIQTCNIHPILTNDTKLIAKRPKYSVLDKSKIKKQIGLTIPHWETSLNKCIEILKK